MKRNITPMPYKLCQYLSMRGKVSINNKREGRKSRSEKVPCLLLDEVLLFSVYPGLQLLSPLVTVGDEFEESFGEVVKFLDGVVLDLVRKNEIVFQKSTFLNM